MLIDCPGCGKSYHIVKAVLGADGRRVACPRCDSIWFVTSDGVSIKDAAPSDITGEAPALAVDLDALAGSDFVPTRDDIKPMPPTAIARRREPSLLVSGLAFIGISMGLIGFRAQIVQIWPSSATAYTALGLPVNLRGLALDHFHAVAMNDGPRTVLGVEGEITNLRRDAVKIPALRLTIRGKDGQTLYSWIVPAQKPRLAANETMNFRARLAAPPAAGDDVLVDFAPSAGKSLAAIWPKAWRF